MSNFLKGCSCYQCKAGKRSKAGGKQIKNAIRKNRRQAKRDLKAGKETNQVVGIGYTD